MGNYYDFALTRPGKQVLAEGVKIVRKQLEAAIGHCDRPQIDS